MAKDMIWELSRPLVDITKTAFEDGFKTQRGGEQQKGAPLYGWRLPPSIDGKKRLSVFPRGSYENQRERRCIVKISFSGPIVTNGKGTIDPIHPNAQKISYIARSTATKEGVPWFEDEEKDVVQVGTNEIAVCVALADDPDGFPCEVNMIIKAETKPHLDSVGAKGREVKAYDRIAEAEAYEAELKAKAAKRKSK